MNQGKPNYKLTKLACYTASFTMSSIFCVPPLLFVTLRDMYDISYTLLGTLVLTNFFTQLTVDLIFTAFSKHFNVRKVLRVMPLITSAGLGIYALIPTFFPQIAYAGLLIGTVIFSVAAGLSEVLISPAIAAIPSDNPQRDMSLLHSVYAFGVFSMVVISTVFLKLFGTQNWMYLVLFLALLPIIAALLLMLSPMPSMEAAEEQGTAKRTKTRTVGLLLCAACIFFGSCAENGMANWISGYVENALGVDKAVGDILGMAMFAVLLGLARILYARYGKNIDPILLIGMICAAVCYLIAGLSTNVIVAFIACIFVGLFASMLWPGVLIAMEERIPGAGVAGFALMAAGGDLGASVSPQLLGIVIDRVAASEIAAELSVKLNLTTEQIGLKAGMLVGAIFPIIGTVLVILFIRFFKKHKTC